MIFGDFLTESKLTVLIAMKESKQFVIKKCKENDLKYPMYE